MNNLGLYLHIPFCKRKCEYCDFYSTTDLTLIPAYVSRLCEDLASKSGDCTGFCVDTVYLGGGTPSLLSCEEIEKIISTVRKCYNLSEKAEITIEVNPSSLTREKAQKYAEIGINRASIGLQSACECELNALGRLHTLSDFDAAFDTLRASGIENISVDLMYGLPNQDLKSIEKSLRYLFAKSPEHISAYCLKIEEGTPFYVNSISEADEDTAYEQYKFISETLEQNGYQRYEVSNFAKNGMTSIHNCKYWLGLEYIGFGPAAYSYFKGVRYGHSRSLEDYLSGRDIRLDEETVTDEEVMRERIIFGLRLSDGVDLSLLNKNTVDRLASMGLLELRGDRACLTTAGLFVSNTIISEFLD